MLVCESHSSHLGSVCGSFLTPLMTFLSVFKIVSASLFMIPHVLIRAIVCLQCAILFFFFSFFFLYLSPAFISHHYTCPTYLVFLSLHRMFVILISPFMLAQTNMSVFFPTIIIILLNLFLFIEIAFPLITSMYNLSSYKLGLK